jgi:hypothetical protein
MTRLWIGQAGKEITDTYSKLRDDKADRNQAVLQGGLGLKGISGKNRFLPTGAGTQNLEVGETPLHWSSTGSATFPSQGLDERADLAEVRHKLSRYRV